MPELRPAFKIGLVMAGVVVQRVFRGNIWRDESLQERANSLLELAL